MTTTTAPSGPILRTLRALPLYGRGVRDVERDVDSIFYLIVIALTALVLAVQTWGLPALVLTAVAMVPVMFVLLILISRP